MEKFLFDFQLLTQVLKFQFVNAVNSDRKKKSKCPTVPVLNMKIITIKKYRVLYVTFTN